MEYFAKFIVDYIEKNEIHGKRGWINQLSGYYWRVKKGIDRFPEGIRRSKDLWIKTQQVLQSSSDEEKWQSHCEEIRTWGHMKMISPDLAKSYKNGVSFLQNNNPGIDCDFTTLPVESYRIAMASKIYYFSDPLRWTIYDSRVGYATHQLIFEYSKEKRVEPTSLFQEISFCLPESHTSRRKPLYPISRCYGNETKAKASFIWVSHLHRLIADELNRRSIQKPSLRLSALPQWELPHIEMVFFMIGDKRWVQ
jgi:hypothetical protein